MSGLRYPCQWSIGRRRRTLLAILALPVLLTLASPAAASPASAVAVAGRVTDEAGQPIAGARVALLPARSLHERGRLLLAGEGAPQPVASPAGPTTSAAPPARPHSSSAQGTPVVAATDAAGRFELSAPEPGLWRLVASAPGRVPLELPLEPLIDPTEVPDARLPRDVGLEVRATDGPGKPLAARAAARPLAEERPTTGFHFAARWQAGDRRAAAGPDGKLRLPRRAGERLLLVLAAPGRPPLTREIGRTAMPGIPGIAGIAGITGTTEVALPEGAAAGTLRAPRAPSALRAVDERGRPVAGALVWDAAALLPLGETDAQGRWSVPLPPTGALSLALSGPGGLAGTLRLPAAAAGKEGGGAAPAEAVATLTAPPRLAGRVIDRATREPVAGALVWLDGDAAGFARADRAGGYELGARLGPEGRLLAAAPGYSGTGSIPGLAFGAGGGPTLVLQPAARLAGRVVDAEGRPVAGAEIVTFPKLAELVGSFDLEELAGIGEPRWTRSGPDGRFRLAALTPGRTWVLSCTREGFATTSLEARPVPAAEAAPEVEIVLGPGLKGVGRVVDPAGKPVPGARVQSFEVSPLLDFGGAGDGGEEEEEAGAMSINLHDDASLAFPGPSAVADGSGRFELPGLSRSRYRLRAEAPGYAPGEARRVQVAGEGPEADLGTIALAAEAAVEGRVVDRAGRPVAGAAVAVLDPMGQPAPGEPEPAAVADAEGRFALRSLAAGRPVRLRASQEGYAAREVPEVMPPARDLRMVLDREARLAGRILDPDRRPVAGATVTAIAMTSAASTAGTAGAGALEAAMETMGTMETMDTTSGGQAETDADGGFEISGVAPGSVQLRADARGYLSRELPAIELPPGGARSGLELVLARGAVLDGQALGPDGEPLSGVMVFAMSAAEGEGRPGGGVSPAYSDGDGRFRLEGLPAGAVTLNAMRDGYLPASREVEVPGESSVTLSLGTGLRLSGRALDEAGRPLAGVMLGLEPTDLANIEDMADAGSFFASPLQARSGEDGRFTIAGVRPGKYALSAVRSGYLQTGGPAAVEVRADRAGVEVRLAPGSLTLSGRLLGLSPAELARVQVMAMGPGGQRSGSVDGEGRYRVTSVAAGTWYVVAMALGGNGRVAQGQVEVPAGTSEATLDLDFNALQTPQELDPDLEPIPGSPQEPPPQEPPL